VQPPDPGGKSVYCTCRGYAQGVLQNAPNLVKKVQAPWQATRAAAGGLNCLEGKANRVPGLSV